MSGKIQTFFILIGVATLIPLATLNVIEGYKKNTPSNSERTSIVTPKTIVDPEKVVAQMQKKLGPGGWKKIEMVHGKWYGPYRVKNGSDWKVAVGEVWVKVDKQRPFLDKPNTNPFVSGEEIKFSPATDKATIFFSY